jgi:hypothetical protein
MQFKQTMASLLVASFVLVVSPLKNAFAETEKLTMKLANDRVVALELIKPKNSNMPTFLFLPGVNRGLIASDDALAALAQHGFGIVAMNFSVQPFSVNSLEKNVRPAFKTKSFNLTELGQEVDALAEQVKKTYQIQNIIPVSISYSSAVSSTLQNYPLIIDVVPMTSSAAVNPQLEAYRATLKAGEVWNPIFGPGITRSLLDQSYYSKWGSQVDAMISAFKLDASRRFDMVEGYTVLSRAAEGFQWDASKTLKTTRRVFMLAHDDDSQLLKNQLELVSKMLQENANVLAFVVNKSGHVMPADQPGAYAAIIATVTTGTMKDATGIVEFDPGANKVIVYKAAEAQKYIRNLINTL